MTLIETISARRRTIVLAVFAMALTAIAFTGVRPARADQLAPAQAVFVAQPNLVVQNTQYINWGGEVFLSFTVKNTGTANAGPFKINVESQNGTVLQQFLSNGLAPNQSTLHAHKLPGCAPMGFVSRTIVADAGNLVAESNEMDNERIENYVYGPSCK